MGINVLPQSNDTDTLWIKSTKLSPEKYRSLKIGAGEGIRTLDPNLGKVVLYP